MLCDAQLMGEQMFKLVILYLSLACLVAGLFVVVGAFLYGLFRTMWKNGPKVEHADEMGAD